MLNRASQFFKSAPETLMERLEQQASEMKALRQALEKFKSEASMGEAKQILASAKTVDGLHVITGTRQGLDANALRLMGDFLRDKDPHVVGDLARDFNHMASEVQHSSQMQRDLLANVSHDLRTPLTLIKGYAETVRDITGDDKAHRDEQMNIIVDETDRLTALVSSVMELSKVTSGADKCERVHFDMGQLCDEVSERYDAICAQNGWQLKLELPDEELPVYADPDMMQRALHNLLGNAMHHIGKDGIFILRAQRCTEGVRVEVEDHGPGISADDLPYIFDRYYRSRSDSGKQGTGLGLSITKAIFQQHGFRFGVQSAIGMGTTFWFIMNDLPANEKKAAQE